MCLNPLRNTSMGTAALFLCVTVAGLLFLENGWVRTFPRFDAKTDAFTSGYQHPLQIFPLIKEMRTGWGNMDVPLPLMRKVPEGMRALVIDVGLDKGVEFFYAIRQGFEVVGFEPNPLSFVGLKDKCQNDIEIKHRCMVIENINEVELPLQRKSGMSYLVHAGAGSEQSELELNMGGAVGSFAKLRGNRKSRKASVPVIRIDDVVADDVFLFKIDTQGYDYHVLLGSTKLFQKYAVRQVITEFDPYSYQQVTGHSSVGPFLKLLQHDYGMMCFADRNDQKSQCQYLGDTVEGYDIVFFKQQSTIVRNGTNAAATQVKSSNGLWANCWDDFLCVNVGKLYPPDRIPMLA